jgi:hypothetical protein
MVLRWQERHRVAGMRIVGQRSIVFEDTQRSVLLLVVWEARRFPEPAGLRAEVVPPGVRTRSYRRRRYKVNAARKARVYTG